MRSASRPVTSGSALLLCLTLLLSSQPAMSRSPSDDDSERAGSPLVGTSADGDVVAIPVRRTSIRASAAGSFASVDVEQLFVNPYDEPIEAAYAFPVPAGASLVEMTMRVGDRTMKGEIRERKEARASFEDAVLQGRRAALVEQSRRGVYGTRVGNVLPGDRVAIRFRYVEPLAFGDGSYSLTIPLVVPPPRRAAEASGAEGSDAKRPAGKKRSGPRYLPRGARPTHDLAVTVDLAPDLPVLGVESSSHEVAVAESGPNRFRVALRKTTEVPDRDFVLSYRVSGDRPQAGMLVAPAPDGGAYFMIDAVPPADAFAAGIIQKELTFVVDTSGSMGDDDRIGDARNALRTLVHGLNPGDAFNIVRFASDFSSFRPAPVPFTQENLDAADAFVAGLGAGGGTEAAPAIQHALRQPRSGNRLRIVAFLTDGELGDYDALMDLLQRELRDARLFTFGIGPAPDDFLARRMAQAGRGGSHHIVSGGDVESAVARFQNDVAAPVLVDVSVGLQGARIVDLSPNPIPDLFASRPLALYGKADRMPTGSATIAATGPSGRVAFAVPVRTAEGRDAETLGMAWAKSRVNSLLDALRLSPDDSELKAEIARLGIEHEIVTPFTSFVVTDDEVVARRGSKPKKVTVPLPRPALTATFGKPKADAGVAPGEGIGAGASSGLGTGTGGGIGAGTGGPGGASGELSGTVTDANGASISGASLTLVDVQTGAQRSGTSDADGGYRFASLPPGTYSLKAEEYGFSTSMVTGLTIRPGMSGRFDVGLEVASVSETVTVAASEEIVDVTSSKQSTVTSRQLQSLPLDGRSSLELARLTPGVSGGRNASSMSFLGGVGFDAARSADDGIGFAALAADAVRPVKIWRALLRAQRADGAFAQSGTSVSDGEIASTAAATLSFLLAGETDRSGRHQAQVRRALEFLRARVGPGGAVAGASSSRAEALTLWALAEATSATGAARYRDAAERVAARLASLEGAGAVTAWTVAALVSARDAGVAIDAGALARYAEALSTTAGHDARALAVRAVATLARPESRAVSPTEWARLGERLEAPETDLDSRLLGFVAARSDSARAAGMKPAVARAISRDSRAGGSVEESAITALLEVMIASPK
jgi:Ca-activated chloride channel homolog